MGTGFGDRMGFQTVVGWGSGGGGLWGLPLPGWGSGMVSQVGWAGGVAARGPWIRFERIHASVEPCVLIVRRGCEVAGCSNLRETLDAASGEAGQRDPLLTIGDAGER